MRTAFVAFFVLLATQLHGQNGDRPGEVQKPPPAHLQIPPSPALSPDEALKTLKVPAGFHVETVASDPLIADPVAMAIDPAGRLWVVEMRGYMPDVDGQGEEVPAGIIAVLEDTDGDGRMDKRTEFATGFHLPRAIALVGDGVLVAEAPHLWFLRDTDGDGKADTRQEIANDYGSPENPEHSANGLVRMLDNWMYNAKHSVRFRYDAGNWLREETLARGQWGIAQDDAGRIFYNSNSDPLRVDVIPDSYLRRNSNIPRPASVNVELAPREKTLVWPGRVTPGVNRGYELLREDGTLPTVTAACGPVIYRGSLFPSEFQGNAFICEPAGNLVKRLLVNHDGETYSATNAYEKSEFLTSTDERFRPVNLYNGPDGALYVLDMYRGVIQHRIFVTTYLRNQVKDRGLETPVGLGRIYRVVPDGSAPATKPQRSLAQFSSEELVQLLSHENGWQRDTAQQLLVERADLKTVPSLNALALTGSNPKGRLHALWTLEGMRKVDADTLRRAVGDSDATVASAAIRLLEPWIARDASPYMADLKSAAERGDLGLRRQVALSLGAAKGTEIDALLFAMAERYGDEPYMDEAILSAMAGRESEVVVALHRATNAEPTSAGLQKVTALAIACILQSKDAPKITEVLNLALGDSAAPEWLREAGLQGIERFLPGGRRSAELPVEPSALLALGEGPETPSTLRVQKMLKSLRWPGKPGMVVAEAVQLSPEQRQMFERGSAGFAICAGCHQPDGQGMNGLAPPLVNSRWALGAPEVVARIVLHGKEGAGMLMPPLGTLDDDTIASILTYVRHSWGHQASAVNPAVIAEVRKATQGRDRPWTDEELEAAVHQSEETAPAPESSH